MAQHKLRGVENVSHAKKYAHTRQSLGVKCKTHAAWGFSSIVSSIRSRSCEGDGDVVGVVTPLRGGAQVVLHGDQVVEVGVRLRVHQDGEVEEDGEGQVEVEREEGEVKERRSCMKMG